MQWRSQGVLVVSFKSAVSILANIRWCMRTSTICTRTWTTHWQMSCSAGKTARVRVSVQPSIEWQVQACVANLFLCPQSGSLLLCRWKAFARPSLRNSKDVGKQRHRQDIKDTDIFHTLPSCISILLCTHRNGWFRFAGKGGVRCNAQEPRLCALLYAYMHV